ncbi:hypothetical protein LSAT2_009186 [Lamellibrachia satsuma]|nr:hypothetical protein LSAT2_009186 [Lamellibrachia satsuma]
MGDNIPLTDPECDSSLSFYDAAMDLENCNMSGTLLNTHDNQWCISCRNLKQTIEKMRDEYETNYKMLKEKIISTNDLIKRYKLKCDEFDVISKKLCETEKKLDISTRASDGMMVRLRQAVEEQMPVKETNAKLGKKVKFQERLIAELQDQVSAVTTLQTQLNALKKESEREKGKLLAECTEVKQQHKQVLVSQKKGEEKLTKTLENMKTLKQQLSAAQRENKKLSKDNEKLQLKLTWQQSAANKQGHLDVGKFATSDSKLARGHSRSPAERNLKTEEDSLDLIFRDIGILSRLGWKDEERSIVSPLPSSPASSLNTTDEDSSDEELGNEVARLLEGETEMADTSPMSMLPIDMSDDSSDSDVIDEVPFQCAESSVQQLVAVFEASPVKLGIRKVAWPTAVDGGLRKRVGTVLLEVTPPEMQVLPEVTHPKMPVLLQVTSPKMPVLPEVTLPKMPVLAEVTTPKMPVLPQVTLPKVHVLPQVTKTLPQVQTSKPPRTKMAAPAVQLEKTSTNNSVKTLNQQREVNIIGKKAETVLLANKDVDLTKLTDKDLQRVPQNTKTTVKDTSVVGKKPETILLANKDVEKAKMAEKSLQQVPRNTPATVKDTSVASTSGLLNPTAVSDKKRQLPAPLRAKTIGSVTLDNEADLLDSLFGLPQPVSPLPVSPAHQQKTGSRRFFPDVDEHQVKPMKETRSQTPDGCWPVQEKVSSSVGKPQGKAGKRKKAQGGTGGPNKKRTSVNQYPVSSLMSSAGLGLLAPGHTVIDEELQLLLRGSVLPAQTATNISRGQPAIHPDVLVNCVANIMYASKADVLPAIHSYCTAEPQQLTQQQQLWQPFMTADEHQILELLLHLDGQRQFVNIFEMLHVKILTILHSTENVLIPGRTALCRLFTAVCRMKGDISRVRVLAYDTVHRSFHAFPRMILAIACVWPEALKADGGEVTCVMRCLQYVIHKNLQESKVTHSQMWQCLAKLCGWQKRSGVQEDATVLATVAIEKLLHSSDEAHLYDAEKALELLSMKEGWQWTNNQLIIKLIWPVLQQWATGGQHPFSDRAIGSLLRVLGVVTNNCPVQYASAAYDIAQTLQALLNHSVNSAVPVCDMIQEAVLEALMLLAPFKPDLSAHACYTWVSVIWTVVLSSGFIRDHCIKVNMESKSAKKNKKRHNKKKPEFQGGAKEKSDTSPEYLLEALKEKLIEAKASQDHARAGKLRDQIWVLTDIVAGVKTDLPNDELLPILESIAAPSKPPVAEAMGDAPKPATSAVDRKLINLQKKLQKIEELKAKKAKGEKLEKNQLQKIETESSVKEEIEELEEMLSNASLVT